MATSEYLRGHATPRLVGYIGRMAIDAVEIVRCPAELRAEALALVLCELAPSLRRQVAGGLLDIEDIAEFGHEPLYIARRGRALRGAAWGQRQSGNIAVFWPPQLEAGEDERTAYELTQAVISDLDETLVEMTQVFLSAPTAETVKVLWHVGFRHLADLMYMKCESSRFPLAAPEPFELEYVPYDGMQRGRLINLIGQTYEDTLDCTALEGVRNIDNVLNGYQGTGVYRPENWLFVRSGGEDVGVLLLADHPKGRHWELMYVALVPAARGRGWGRQITRYAQWLARGANVERIVVAVDASNSPAVAMYRDSGFDLWDERAVYVRAANRS
jgi:ribosomal protein S18 acetylase RimI-like enzyme